MIKLDFALYLTQAQDYLSKNIFAGLIIGAFAVMAFIASCVLLHKAHMGWGWMFVPFVGTYKCLKMVKMTGVFWGGLIVAALSAVFLAIGGNVCGIIGFILLCILGLMLVVFTVVYYAKLAPAFGKRTLFALGLIFLTSIFLCILAFGSAEYRELD